ncbi:MAG: hypothetical protein ACE361_08080 [Aureliella sp.]
MSAPQLVNAISELRPEYTPAQHLRIALLLSLEHENIDALAADPVALERSLLEVTIKLSATTDQHAAVAGDLDSLASTSPCEFTPQHLWTLVRALKIQSQILNLYLG